MRYRSPEGVWKGRPTGYRWSNLGDVRQAKILARKATEREAEAAGSRGRARSRFGDWVLPWLLEKYGKSTGTTAEVYKRTWRTVSKFLDEHQLTMPAQIRRDHAGIYLTWRTAGGNAGRNTAIADIKLLAMVLDEAKGRGLCQENPLRKLGLKKDKCAEKLIWSHEDISRAAAHFEREQSHWMLCAFYFGLYQAARLRQCQLPLAAIRLEAGMIHYPDHLVKGGAGFTQPIDARFLPRLKSLMAAADGETICTVPWDASIRLRRSLDRAGLPGLCHHGLRASWITRAAEAGVPESHAMAFCHHESREVHRVYKKLSSIGIAHVPALIPLPALPLCGDLPAASGGSAEELKTSHTPARTRAPRRRGSGSVTSRKTARAQ